MTGCHRLSAPFVRRIYGAGRSSFISAPGRLNSVSTTDCCILWLVRAIFVRLLCTSRWRMASVTVTSNELRPESVARSPACGSGSSNARYHLCFGCSLLLLIFVFSSYTGVGSRLTTDAFHSQVTARKINLRRPQSTLCFQQPLRTQTAVSPHFLLHHHPLFVLFFTTVRPHSPRSTVHDP